MSLAWGVECDTSARLGNHLYYEGENTQREIGEIIFFQYR